MKRRDFLRFRSSGELQVINLSCEHLYIAYNDARSCFGNVADELSSSDVDWWSGEPPLAVESQQVDQLFTGLGADLTGADVLILEDREWLQDQHFAIQVERLLSEFRAQGGEVRYATEAFKTDSNTTLEKNQGKQHRNAVHSY